MDQIVVDCGDDVVEPGEEVVLFGDGTRGEPTATEWADTLGTIDYEIVTGMYRPRVARSYRGDGVQEGRRAVGGAIGVAAAGTAIAVGVARKRAPTPTTSRRRAFGELRPDRGTR